jgi:hypothetical protein
MAVQSKNNWGTAPLMQIATVTATEFTECTHTLARHAVVTVDRSVALQTGVLLNGLTKLWL